MADKKENPSSRYSRKVWRGEEPTQQDRKDLLKQIQEETNIPSQGQAKKETVSSFWKKFFKKK